MDLKSQGFNVKAYIHCNPNNPLGDVYNEETNLKLMKICAKHQIHFISDEIYALTIHNSKRKDEFKRLANFHEIIFTKFFVKLISRYQKGKKTFHHIPGNRNLSFCDF